MSPEVRNFFKKIKFRKIESYSAVIKYLNETVGFLQGKQIDSLIEERQKGKYSNAEFWKLKNKDLQTSLAISCAYNSDYFERILEYILKNAEYVGENVLFVGCDCGIEPCFLATIMPEIKITAIDIESSSIKNAKELAAQLGINNVTFKCQDFRKVTEKYDTMFSFRMIHEVENFDAYQYIGYALFDEKRPKCKTLYLPIATCMANCLQKDGVLFSWERVLEADWLGYLDALNDCGMGDFVLETASIPSVHGTDKLSITVAYKDGKPSDVYKIWTDLFDSDIVANGYKLEGTAAEIFVNENKGTIIEGYYVKYQGQHRLRAVLYELADNPGYYIYEYRQEGNVTVVLASEENKGEYLKHMKNALTIQTAEFDIEKIVE